MRRYPTYRRPVVPAVALLLVAASAACSSPGSPAGRRAPRTAPSTSVTSPRAASTTSTPATTTTAVPPFTSTVAAVTAGDLGATWHPGCPVDPSQLRRVTMPYFGFDGTAHSGVMVVNAAVVDQVVQVFATLYAARFPLAEMVPVSAYGGDDNAAAAADDTSGFNCRDAVASGPPHWSVHAYGEAIDVNDVQNPYIEGGTVIPAAGTAYENRSDVRPGMAVAGGVLVQAFAAVGWQWGGRWTGTPDYQHFSATGG